MKPTIQIITSFIIVLLFSSTTIKAQEGSAYLAWSRSYGTTRQEFPVVMKALTSETILMVASQTTGNSPDYKDVWLGIADLGGNVIDTTTINFGVRETVSEVAINSDGSFTLIGNMSDYSLWICRLNDSFEIQYSRSLPYAMNWENQYGSFVVNDSLTMITTSIDSSMCLIGINESGDVVSEMIYPSIENATEMWGVGIKPYADGYVIGANTLFWHDDYGDMMPTIVFVDSNFTYINSTIYHGGLDGLISSPLIDFEVGDSSLIYLLVNSWGHQSVWDDTYLFAVDNTGSLVWTGVYGGTNNDGAKSIVSCGNGDLLLTGSSRSYGTGSVYGLWAFKINVAGEVLWNFTGTDGIYGSIVSSHILNPYQYLVYYAEGTDYQVHLARMDERTDGIEVKDTQIQSYNIESVFPNPTNASTTISYRLGKKTNVSITIFDITGKESWSGHFSAQSPGVHSLLWSGINMDGSSVHSGLYIIQVSTPEWVDSRKFIILK